MLKKSIPPLGDYISHFTHTESFILFCFVLVYVSSRSRWPPLTPVDIKPCLYSSSLYFYYKHFLVVVVMYAEVLNKTWRRLVTDDDLSYIASKEYIWVIRVIFIQSLVIFCLLYRSSPYKIQKNITRSDSQEERLVFPRA